MVTFANITPGVVSLKHRWAKMYGVLGSDASAGGSHVLIDVLLVTSHLYEPHDFLCLYLFLSVCIAWKLKDIDNLLMTRFGFL